jgi:hypothetical protein
MIDHTNTTRKHTSGFLKRGSAAWRFLQVLPLCIPRVAQCAIKVPQLRALAAFMLKERNLDPYVSTRANYNGDRLSGL